MRGRMGTLSAVAAMAMLAGPAVAQGQEITSNVDRGAESKRRSKVHAVYMPQHRRNRGTGTGFDRAHDRECAKAAANAAFYAHLPPASAYPLTTGA